MLNRPCSERVFRVLVIFMVCSGAYVLFMDGITMEHISTTTVSQVLQSVVHQATLARPHIQRQQHHHHQTHQTHLDIDADAQSLEHVGMKRPAMKPVSSLCPEVPPNLIQEIRLNLSIDSLSAVESELSSSGVSPGGSWKPPRCLSRSRTVVLVPYRDRARQLPSFLQHIHLVMQHQQLHYSIFIVEQTSRGRFNRGMLLNVGFVESKKRLSLGGETCIFLHDVDYLVESELTLYRCDLQHPKHMAARSSNFKYRLPYAGFFGAVSCMTANHFQLVNGFSNIFWGWGGEDDDLGHRIRNQKLVVIGPGPDPQGRYFMMSHARANSGPENTRKMKEGKARFATDGLNSLKYELVSESLMPLYTHILVELDDPAETTTTSTSQTTTTSMESSSLLTSSHVSPTA